MSWTPGIDDVEDFPGLQEPLDVLTTYMKTRTSRPDRPALLSWMAVHAFSEVMKNQTGTPTSASVLAAFKAARDIPMNDIIPPWTPTDYQSAGSLSNLFQNVSNPFVYEVTYDGSGTHTSPSQRFSTFEGLDATTTSTPGGG